MSKELLDLLDTAELLKLLNSTGKVESNHPFIAFCNTRNIKSGSHLVPVKLLLEYYKCTETLGTLTESKVRKICQGMFILKYKKNVPCFSINYTERYLKSRIKQLKKPNFISYNLMVKWDAFAKHHPEQIKTLSVKKLFELYARWRFTTNKKNPMTFNEFKEMHKIFKGERVRTELGDDKQK